MPSRKSRRSRKSSGAQVGAMLYHLNPSPVPVMPSTLVPLIPASIAELEQCYHLKVQETSDHNSIEIASQRSISTDEGPSPSDGGSACSMVCSEGPETWSSGSPCLGASNQLHNKVARALPHLPYMPNTPLWVDNGLEGDETAWLLVMPKTHVAPGSQVLKPKTPNDTMLLGPYVTTRNTFLDVLEVGEVLNGSRRSRCQSWGPRRVVWDD